MTFVKPEPDEDGPRSIDRLECRLKSIEQFKTILNCTASLQPEYLTMRVMQDRLCYFGLDKNQVSLIQWELFQEAFEFFSMSTNDPKGEFLISVSMPLVQKVLKLAGSKEIVCLQYDTNVNGGSHLEISFLDPTSDIASGGVGLLKKGKKNVKEEMNTDAPNSGNDSAVQIKAEIDADGNEIKTSTSGEKRSLSKLNSFSIGTRDCGSERLLELPPIKEESTSVEMPISVYKMIMDSLIELQLPDQKNATCIVQCPRETILDAGKNDVSEIDIVRFGTSNMSGEMSLDFMVSGRCMEKSCLELHNENPLAQDVYHGPDIAFELKDENAQVLLTRGSGFSTESRNRFGAKFIHQMGQTLTIADKFIFHVHDEYPFIAVLPLQYGYGVVRWVISPRVEDEDEEGDQQDGHGADVDPFAADEDEFSDG